MMFEKRSKALKRKEWKVVEVYGENIIFIEKKFS